MNVLEVEHLIWALKAADRKLEHRVYKDAPGQIVANSREWVRGKNPRRRRKFLPLLVMPRTGLEPAHPCEY